MRSLSFFLREMSKANEILIPLLMVSVAVNVVLYINLLNKQNVKIETRTEYVTIKDTMPTPTAIHLTGEEIAVALPLHQHAAKHEPDNPVAYLVQDTIAAININGDTAIVTLPVEQRVYEDTLYTAYVSGYRPRLDSITLRLPHTYTTVTRTVNKDARRWAVGPTIGAGYGIVGRQADVFVGVSVTWNILP